MDNCCRAATLADIVDELGLTMVLAALQLLEHLVLIIVLRLGLFFEKIANLGQLLEYHRPQAQRNFVVKLSVDLDCWSMVGK